jgi:hypothetical protein
MSWDIRAFQVHELSMTIPKNFTFILFRIALLQQLTEVLVLELGFVTN